MKLDWLKAQVEPHVEMVLVGAFLLSIFGMLIGAILLDMRWKHERCIEALKEPAVGDSVRMGLCK